MVGKTISHYKILKKIGEGGMGVVYQAKDMKLERTVALKFISPQLLKNNNEKARLVREAKAAAAISHPNVTVIHEINEVANESFISMEYIEGQTLSDKIDHGPLPVEEAINIAAQIADGLQEAHKKGIVHRDIKSANIMITSKGQVKIMDFGLVKMSGQTQLTKSGTTVGTVVYLSPEQAMGKDVDHRTDLWSLGVVIYEMVTGRLPFRGDYEQAVVYSILNEEPIPLSASGVKIPVEFEKLIEGLLAKSPSDRYQKVADLMVSLKEMKVNSGEIMDKVIPSPIEKKNFNGGRLIIPGIIILALFIISGYFIFLGRHRDKPVSDITAKAEILKQNNQKKSIAVLPFVDRSQKKDQEYFCDGMTDEVINRLANIKELKVMARTSVFTFKEKADDIKTIGEALGVQYILEGSIRKEGNRLRITLQLVNAYDGFQIWSKTFNKELTSIFNIQDEIALAVAEKLKLTLLGSEKYKVTKHHTENLEAFTLYLRGRFLLYSGNTKSLEKAKEYFTKAIEVDPKYALGYAGLAICYTSMGEAGADPELVIPKAREAALKALEIDHNLPEAHLAIGSIKLYFEWDWAGAEAAFLQAIKLNPNDARAHLAYANNLKILKRYDEVLERARKGTDLDPLSIFGILDQGDVLRHKGRYKEARVFFQKAFELAPESMSVHYGLWLLSLSEGNDEDTQREMEKLMELGGFPFWPATSAEMKEFRIICQQKGWRGGLQWSLDQMMRRAEKEQVSPFVIASFNILLGNKEAGIQWLEKAYDRRDMLMPYINSEPLLDPCRKNPRFQEILKKMGFVK